MPPFWGREIPQERLIICRRFELTPCSRGILGTLSSSRTLDGCQDQGLPNTWGTRSRTYTNRDANVTCWQVRLFSQDDTWPPRAYNFVTKEPPQIFGLSTVRLSNTVFQGRCKRSRHPRCRSVFCRFEPSAQHMLLRFCNALSANALAVGLCWTRAEDSGKIAGPYFCRSPCIY